ncbi:MAG: ABC transporter permease, partial [Pseudomonadota bacterium]|nr:ABC transporter permease [Pseudomonadota bacterium]
MYAYLIRRVLAVIPVMFVVAIVVFLLIDLKPGVTAAIISGDFASPEDIARIRKQLGLDQPLYIQFATWLFDILGGDLGTSIFSNLPVSHFIQQRLEPT